MLSNIKGTPSSQKRKEFEERKQEEKKEKKEEQVVLAEGAMGQVSLSKDKEYVEKTISFLSEKENSFVGVANRVDLDIVFKELYVSAVVAPASRYMTPLYLPKSKPVPPHKGLPGSPLEIPIFVQSNEDKTEVKVRFRMPFASGGDFATFMFKQHVSKETLDSFSKDDIDSLFTDRSWRECFGEAKLAKKSQNKLASLYGKILFEACCGVADLHTAGLMWLDTKPQNILLFKDGAKIADYGLCRFINDPRQYEGHSVITDGYRPPELDTSDIVDNATPAADVFSLGVLMLDMFFQTFFDPFYGQINFIINGWYRGRKWSDLLTDEKMTLFDLMKKMAIRPPAKLKKGAVETPWGEWENMKKQAQEVETKVTNKFWIKLAKLTMKCLQVDPSKRPTSIQVVQYLSKITGYEYFPAKYIHPRVSTKITSGLQSHELVKIYSGFKEIKTHEEKKRFEQFMIMVQTMCDGIARNFPHFITKHNIDRIPVVALTLIGYPIREFPLPSSVDPFKLLDLGVHLIEEACREKNLLY